MSETIAMSQLERSEFLRLRAEQRRFEAESREHRARAQLCDLRMAVINREQDAWMMAFAFRNNIPAENIKNLQFDPDRGLVRVTP